MKVLILDNYDSFTYNLLHYVEQFCDDVTVRRNDAISIGEIAKFDAIMLSPGPGLPTDAGVMPELIKCYASSKRILGVCLGHQAIGEVFGAKLRNLDHVLHGLNVPVTITDPSELLFRGLGPRIDTGRYHSWVIDRKTIPPSLRITAVDDADEIMALRHMEFDVCGVQFHPESLLTPDGLQMIRNWVRG